MNEKAAENANIDKKHLYKVLTMNKLASFFGVPKAALREDIDFSEELLWSDLLRESFSFSYVFHCVHIDLERLNLAVLWEPKKFLKSTLYEEFRNAEETNGGPDDNFVMAIHSNKANTLNSYVLVMYRVYDIQEIIGGSFVRISDDEAYIIEPLKNFLQKRYPKEEEPID